MTTFLRQPRWSKVDLVDRGADAHAKIAIWKRDAPGFTLSTGSETGNSSEFSVTKMQPSPGSVHLNKPLSKEEEEEDGKKKKTKKRDFGSDERRALASEGNALPDGSFPIVTKQDLSNAIQAFGRAKDKEAAKRHIIKRARALGVTSILPEPWQVSKKEEGTVPEKLSEEIFKGLDPEVQSHLEALYESLEEKGTGDEPPPSSAGDGSDPAAGTDISKRDDIPEDVRELIAKRDAELDSIRKRAEEAETVAKFERDARILKEWESKVEVVKAVVGEDPAAVAKELKELSDTKPELAEKLYKRFVALNEQAETSKLFEEIGKAESYANSSEGRLESVAKSLREKDPNLSEAQAMEKALELNPDLYSNYINEKGW